MARRKRVNRRRRPIRLRSYQGRSRNDFAFDLELEPALSRELLGIILVGFAIFVFLAIIGAAGGIGNVFYQVLRIGLGFASFILPFVLLVFGVALFYPRRYHLKTGSFVGLLLFILALSAFIHLWLDEGNSQELALVGGGGGFLGFLISQSLLRLVSFWGSFVILLVLLFSGLLMSIGKPLKDLFSYLRSWFAPPTAVPLSRSTKVEVSENGAKRQLALPPTKGTSLVEKGKGQVPRILKPKESAATEFVPRFIQDDSWTPPPIALLNNESTQVDSGNIAQNVAIIEESFANFGIKVEMAEVNIGPTVTQYTLKPARGVKLSRITALSNDLALALAAHPLRIEAPIPGRSLVGIEVPNRRAALVRLREILESEAFAAVHSPLTIPLGRDVAGTPVAADLIKMPHLLIAGATGAGKSVFLHSLLLALLYQNSPNELRLILVDPKRVEFTAYNEVSHLLAPVIVEPLKTMNALKWLISEMEKRYEQFSEHRVRMIEDFNKLPQIGRLPYIVLIIDELADLMVVSAREVETYLVRLAQMARAVGIHLVISTQRPSVDVLTGLIKANFPSRLAFNVTSGTDSRTILDTVGAEKLLGNGDMLFLPQELAKPRRIQGVYVSDREVKAVADFLKKKEPAEYVEEIVREAKEGTAFGGVEGEGDELLEEAAKLVVETGKASASYLQRRFRIGYARAARLLDLLEEQGIVGPGEGAKPRDILIDKYEFFSRYGEPPSGGEEDNSPN